MRLKASVIRFFVVVVVVVVVVLDAIGEDERV